MGLLGFKSRPNTGPDTAHLLRLPSGTFSLDPAGRMMASTLPRTFPPQLVQQIGEAVMSAFEEARASHIFLTELIIDYPALKLTARELRGGAIIFLAPRSLGQR
jgi:hypothetical protein